MWPQQIGAVRSYLQIQHRIAGEELADRCAHLRIRRQNEQPIHALGQPEFLRAAQHPMALHAAQLAHLDLESGPNTAPGSASGTLSPTW